MAKFDAATRKFSCGPYSLRISRYGLHLWIEVALPYYTVTLNLLRR